MGGSTDTFTGSSLTGAQGGRAGCSLGVQEAPQEWLLHRPAPRASQRSTWGGPEASPDHACPLPRQTRHLSGTTLWENGSAVSPQRNGHEPPSPCASRDPAKGRCPNVQSSTKGPRRRPAQTPVNSRRDNWATRRQTATPCGGGDGRTDESPRPVWGTEPGAAERAVWRRLEGSVASTASPAFETERKAVPATLRFSVREGVRGWAHLVTFAARTRLVCAPAVRVL